MKLPDYWNLFIRPGELLNLNKMLPVYCIPEYEVFIGPSLSFIIRIFACLLPNNHSLYTDHEKSLNNITVSNLITLLNNFTICNGLNMFASGIIPHVVQKVFDVNNNNNSSPIQQKIFYRSSNCHVLISDEVDCAVCSHCLSIEKYENKNLIRKNYVEMLPAKLKSTSQCN